MISCVLLLRLKRWTLCPVLDSFSFELVSFAQLMSCQDDAGGLDELFCL